MPESQVRRDPFPVYCFKVEFGNSVGFGHDDATAFFQSVSGLKYETEVTDFSEGGENRFTHRLVGATKWGNLVLKRGFSKSFSLIQWRESWLDPNKKPKRIATGKIIQLDTKLKPVCQWQFKDGWPCKWELSDYDASKSELAIETMEIAHHGLQFIGS